MFQQPGDSYTNIANLKEHLKQKTADELRSELDDIFAEEASTGIKIDQEVVEAYLTAIELAEPNGSIDGDFETSWEAFIQNHPELFEKPKPKARRVPVRYLIEVAALIACLLIGSAAAFPAQWNALVTWGKEVLNIASPTSGAMENVELAEFASLASAVESLGVDSSMLPTWIPKPFSIREATIQSAVLYDRAAALYSDGKEHTITIRVTHYFSTSDMPFFSLEINEDEEREYIQNGVSYYISENFGSLQAKWIQGNCVYSIVGNITETELTKIINSIPGG